MHRPLTDGPDAKPGKGKWMPPLVRALTLRPRVEQLSLPALQAMHESHSAKLSSNGSDDSFARCTYIDRAFRGARLKRSSDPGRLGYANRRKHRQESMNQSRRHALSSQNAKIIVGRKRRLALSCYPDLGHGVGFDSRERRTASLRIALGTDSFSLAPRCRKTALVDVNLFFELPDEIGDLTLGPA